MKYELPKDYVHILNCICEFKELSSSCTCPIIRTGANKLDTNKESSVITNYYTRPSINQVYYCITNIEDPESIANSEERENGKRYGNSVLPTIEIKCGNLGNKYSLEGVYVEYLRAPKYVNLTQDDLDEVEDNTKVLEFPDYVVYEIINELVTSILENGKDPRTQTFIPINTTIPQK